MRLPALVVALLCVLALPAAAPAQDPAPGPSPAPAFTPGATTGAARDVERTAATLTGTVDPNGTATTYRFEYGTGATYGLSTGERAAGAGDTAGPAEAPVTGLTPGTTYHYRIVATSAAGTTAGADRSFRTDPDPRPPGVSGAGTREIGAETALLRGFVDPNGTATTYRFEYGATRGYGTQTPERSAGAGGRRVPVSEPVGALRPHTRYHFRLVATNAAGTTSSRNRTFVTSRQPTAVTLAVARRSIPWGGGVEVFGRVSGIGIDGIPIALERQDFPFAGPFSSLGTPPPVRTDRGGGFRVFVPALFSTTRLRAVTRIAVAVTSPAVAARVAVRVGARTRRLPRRRMRLRGSVQPAAPNGRAILQRRGRRGRWAYVRGADLEPARGDRSHVTFTVRRRSRARTFRIRVIARDGGAHVPGNSRAIRVPGARRR